MRRPPILAAVVLVCFGLCGSAARVAHGTWVYWDPALGGNGHYYLAVAVPEGINWHDAQAAAEAAGGYLATATSQSENSFIFSLVDSAEFWVASWNDWALGPWLGGLQPPGSPEPDGGWRWVTGEAFSYSNWHPVQPNNDPSENQDRIHMARPGYPNRGATWNDLDGTVRLLLSYVVEAPGPSLPAPDFDSGWRGCSPGVGRHRGLEVRHGLDVARPRLTVKTLLRLEGPHFGVDRYQNVVLEVPRTVVMLDRNTILVIPGCTFAATQHRVQIWTHR